MRPTPFISHVEWFCRDLERGERFLRELFGWHFQRFSQHYFLYTPEKGPAVGLMQREDFQPGNGCLVFIQVENIETYLEKAQGLDGGIAVGKTQIPDYGWYAQLTDPDGNIVGLYESA
jgi:predicted enzyme related to lactoylglutathione lyase